MATDLLRVQSNERVDLNDFQALANELAVDNERDAFANAWTDPNKTRVWILDGFEAEEVDTPERVRVTRGRALCGYKVGGVVKFGMLAASGDATKEIDVSSFPNNTYGVYVRFEYVDADLASRVFWNPSGSGSEFAQAIYTRKEANWSMRVEAANPGSEWIQVAEFTLSGGELSGYVDKRNFFFEGDASASPAFESGWSSQGGGAANDRNSDRATYGVKDLQTFTAATRQCLEDIKGRGLRKWYELGIGGLNVGFDTDPTEAVVAVGDGNFKLDWNSGTPRHYFDSNDYLGYDRVNNRFQFWIQPSFAALLDADGFFSQSGPGLTVRRDSPATSTSIPGFNVKHVTTSNMADGFGAALDFLVTDTGISDEITGRIGTRRNGSDTQHDLQFFADSGGLAERARLAYTGFLSVERSLYVGNVLGADPGDNNIQAAGNVTADGNVNGTNLLATGYVEGDYFSPTQRLTSDPGGAGNQFYLNKRNAVSGLGRISAAGSVHTPISWNIASATWTATPKLRLTPHDGFISSALESNLYGAIFAASQSQNDQFCTTGTFTISGSNLGPEIGVWDVGSSNLVTANVVVMWLGGTT